MPRTRAKVIVHFIFSTKHRESVFHDGIRNELHGFLIRTLRELRSPAILINSVEDHIHILSLHSEKQHIEGIARELKRNLMTFMENNRANASGFHGQFACAAALVRKSLLGKAVEYLLRQKEHRRTFEQEYQEFLKRYGLAPKKPFQKGIFRPFKP